jgi:hypothetical protein
MNTLLTLLSLVLGICFTGCIYKLCEYILPTCFTTINFKLNDKSRFKFYLIKIKNCTAFAFWILLILFFSHIISLYLISNDFNVWFVFVEFGIAITLIICVWIIIQYIGDLLWDYGLKGIWNKCFSILNMKNALWIYILFLVIGVLLVNFGPVWIAEIFVMWIFQGVILLWCIAIMLGMLEIKVKSNVEERINLFKSLDMLD